MKKQRLANVSPWLLAAAGALLALIITIFAVSNYRREKELMSEALLQQGLTITRFVASSSRASLRRNFNTFRSGTGQWTDYVQQAIDNSADHPGLHFMGLINAEGEILAGTAGAYDKEIDRSSYEFLQSLEQGERPDNVYIYRKKDSTAGSVFQVATLYFPFGHGSMSPRGRGPMWMRHDNSGPGREAARRQMSEQLEEIRSRKFMLLVELDLDEFNESVQRQLIQIVSLSLVLLLVGIGGWLSLLTLQGLKGSQRRLRQIREFTDMLVSSLPVGLIATDSNGNIRIFNRSAEKMVGIAASEAIGNNAEKVLPFELSEELRQKHLPPGGKEQKEILISDGKVKSRSLMTTALPVMDSDRKYAGNTLLIQDLSQVKNLQRELRRNERLAVLGKMAAGVAHELRNPLSSIKGLALLLKAKVQQDRQGEDTAEILIQEVERLNRSIGELLDYARPHTLQTAKLDIAEVLDKSVALITADADSAGILLETNYEAGKYVNGDRDKLIQVFLNLLLNSVQAMSSGGTLMITVEQDENSVVCRIEDTGCGLDEEGVARVFDPYFTTKPDGTGLGLAMSARIIEEHSGSIEFSSSVGMGTIVKVVLPSYLEES